MATMYELRDQILGLSADERANLLALCEREEVRAPYVASREDAELWTAVTTLSPPGTVPWRHLGQFLGDKHHGVSRQAWREAVKLLGEFAALAKPVRHRAEDRQAIIELALDCLVSDMNRVGDTVNPKAILAALPRLHAAFDRAFPGYVEAGLVHKLIRLVPVQRLQEAIEAE